MSKPWITLTLVTRTNQDRVGVGIRVKGPAPRKGSDGPVIQEISETLEGGLRGPDRAALRALQIAVENRWLLVRLRIQDKGTHKRLKGLIKGGHSRGDDLLEEILRLACTFQEVAIRRLPRKKELQSKWLAREAAGLPRVKQRSQESDDDEWWYYFLEEGDWFYDYSDDEIPF